MNPRESKAHKKSMKIFYPPLIPPIVRLSSRRSQGFTMFHILTGHEWDIMVKYPHEESFLTDTNKIFPYYTRDCLFLRRKIGHIFWYFQRVSYIFCTHHWTKDGCNIPGSCYYYCRPTACFLLTLLWAKLCRNGKKYYGWYSPHSFQGVCIYPSFFIKIL